MSRLLKPLTQWDEADVLALIAEKIEEGQRVEYKRELQLGSRGQNAEAAKDVSGMANASGGLLIYGVEEKELPDGRRVPTGATPISQGDADAQLEDVLYSSVSPQLNLATAMVPAAAGGYFLLVRVQQRSGPLHMVEGHGQHRYFIRAGLATRPMAAHEVEAAFRALASVNSQLLADLADMPIVPRISPSRIKGLEVMGSGEPGGRPWVSVVVAPLDPGAELEMRAPTRQDFSPLLLHAKYLRDASYLTDGSFAFDASGYLDEFRDDRDVQIRTLRLYRNGWCEWGFRYVWDSDPDGQRIPGRAFLESAHDALAYFAQTYVERGYFGRIRVWIRIDNSDNSELVREQRFRDSMRTPRDEEISFETDTNVEHVLGSPLTLIHAAMDRIWQGYGLTGCDYFSAEGELRPSR